MPAKRGTVRRSVALPGRLVAEAKKVAPKDLRDNLNRLVVVSLEEYVKHRKTASFEEAMAAMAADPAIRKASADIQSEFGTTELDGLKDD